jgi:hypothetical protein
VELWHQFSGNKGFEKEVPEHPTPDLFPGKTLLLDVRPDREFSPDFAFDALECGVLGITRNTVSMACPSHTRSRVWLPQSQMFYQIEYFCKLCRNLQICPANEIF